MTETTVEAAAPATPKGKKVKGAGAKKAKTAPSHPPVSQMVTAAIKALKERGGSSTQAIKKYISSTYKIDAEKKSHFIKKHLVSAVASGSLVQTKGKGASGSFKLAVAGEKKVSAAKKAPAKAAVKTKSPKVKKVAAKKVSTPKVKKTKKPPTATKAPKPKVAKAKPAAKPKAKKAPVKKAPAKKAAPKKASPKKK